MADDQHLAQWQNKMRQSGGASASNANAAKEAEERKKKEAYVRIYSCQQSLTNHNCVVQWKNNVD